MSNNVDSKGVTISVKIYEHLLATCPTDFRREYGPAMKQLFRDQCRDAWSQTQGRGLAVLWLRALADLAKTALVEHLTNMQLRTAFSRVFLVVFASALFWGIFLAYWTPRVYFSTAKVLVKDTPMQQGENRERFVSGSDSDLHTQCARIRSIEVLGRVITNLNLQHVLASQAGQPDWSLDQTYNRFVQQVDLVQRFASPTHDNSVIDITVKNADPNLAANIANAILQAYRDESFLDNQRAIRVETPRVGVTCIRFAQPNPNSAVQPKRKIFLMWAFGGMLLAFAAGGVGAWLTYLIQPISHRQGMVP